MSQIEDFQCRSSGDEHNISLEQMFERLNGSAEGLSSEEANKRGDLCGRNVFEETRKDSLLIRYLKQYKNFFSLLLLFGSILSFIAEWLDPGQGNIFIAIALLGVVILNGTFTFIQEYQAERIMASFKNLIPPKARVMRDGKITEILATDIVVGDVIYLEEGDKIPADGRLIEENSLKVDNSPITGEAEPQLRSLECTHPNILECRNMVFSGTLVQTGNGKAIIFGIGSDTQIGKLAALTEQTISVDTPIRRELNDFIKIISAIAIFLGVSFFIVGFLIQDTFLANLIFAIGIIVANVPEGLLPTVTLALSLASKRMAKRNALIKQLESVETLGSTTVICTDKTGTLTQNKMAIHSVYTGSGHLDVENKATPSDVLLRVATVCNNSRLTEEAPGYKGDPTEGSLLVYSSGFTDIEKLKEDYPRMQEYPFDSRKQRMQVISKTPSGELEAYLKGAPEVILDMCSHVLVEGKEEKLDEKEKQLLEKEHLEMAKRGERVLAFAYRKAESAKEYQDGFIFLGFAGAVDPPRPEAKEAIIKCHMAGIKVVMITGDHPVTARSIAATVGLTDDHKEPVLITGAELEELSTDELTQKLKAPSIVFARTSPVQKLKIVQAFQAAGEIVTMTGDGVNDAPAMKNADMGVAMGSGTDVAKEAADMVLLDDNFATIVNAIEEGRTVFDNIKKFIAYILTSNIPEILPFIAFVLLALPLPMNVQLILAIDLGTDILPALSLAVEKGEGDIMKRPPRKRDEKLLTPQVLLTSYGVKGPIEAAAGFACYFAVMFDGGWTWGQQLPFSDPLYMQAITAFFAAVIICQIANVFTSRTRRQSVLTKGFFSNRMVLLGIASELLILSFIIFNPFVNMIFNTAAISMKYILIAVPFALLLLGIDELRKYAIRKDSAFAIRFFKW
ncbi:cation-translocating P-type ATPase [Methanolobus profundi]|uniref:Sodium/potassium-transporting ATPase subunit alpha n=1 Tax=Methanolobus profundi TaxID=487685 RepID=A0A1I4RZJ6_9EURY|nr:cation-transporting P-type ATPase [Methanolobus profundi]SFM57373.1 sodium/potassium-transporting ATPase subunit alpha [Methanolobus profundi]